MLLQWINGHYWFASEFLDADGGTGGSGGGTGDQENQGLKNLLAKHNNDAMALAAQLYADNYQLREKNRTVNSDLADVKKRLPADGTVVLSGDDAQQWAAYTALGKVDDLKTKLSQRDQLERDQQELRRDSVVRTVADELNYKFPVLKKLADDVELIVKKETIDNQQKDVVYVKDGDKETPIKDYIAKAWADFIPSLTKGNNQQQSSSGIFFPRQRANDQSANQTDAVDSYLNSTYVLPSKRKKEQAQ